MSWDVWIQDLPSDAKCVDDIPDGFKPGPIGSRAEIIAGIREVAPDLRFSDEEWGDIDGPDFSISVHIPKGEQIDGVSLNIYGGGLAAGVVAAIVGRLGLRALDTASDTGFFDPSTATESFKRWQKYRDQVVNRGVEE